MQPKGPETLTYSCFSNNMSKTNNILEIVRSFSSSQTTTEELFRKEIASKYLRNVFLEMISQNRLYSRTAMTKKFSFVDLEKQREEWMGLSRSLINNQVSNKEDHNVLQGHQISLLEGRCRQISSAGLVWCKDIRGNKAKIIGKWDNHFKLR